MVCVYIYIYIERERERFFYQGNNFSSFLYQQIKSIFFIHLDQALSMIILNSSIFHLPIVTFHHSSLMSLLLWQQEKVHIRNKNKEKILVRLNLKSLSKKNKNILCTLPDCKTITTNIPLVD